MSTITHRVTAPFAQNVGLVKSSGLEVSSPESAPGEVQDTTTVGKWVTLTNGLNLHEDVGTHTLEVSKGTTPVGKFPGVSLELPKYVSSGDGVSPVTLEGPHLTESIYKDGGVNLQDKTHGVKNKAGTFIADSYWLGCGLLSPTPSCRAGEGESIHNRPVKVTEEGGTLLVSDPVDPVTTWIITPYIDRHQVQ